MIIETVSTDDPNDLASDTDVMSELAIDNAFKQYIGADPAVGGKVGQLIDTSVTPSQTLYWDGSAQISTKGDTGPEGLWPTAWVDGSSSDCDDVPVDGSGTLGLRQQMSSKTQSPKPSVPVRAACWQDR